MELYDKKGEQKMRYIDRPVEHKRSIDVTPILTSIDSRLGELKIILASNPPQQEKKSKMASFLKSLKTLLI